MNATIIFWVVPFYVTVCFWANVKNFTIENLFYSIIVSLFSLTFPPFKFFPYNYPIFYIFYVSEVASLWEFDGNLCKAFMHWSEIFLSLVGYQQVEIQIKFYGNLRCVIWQSLSICRMSCCNRCPANVQMTTCLNSINRATSLSVILCQISLHRQTISEVILFAFHRRILKWLQN